MRVDRVMAVLKSGDRVVGHASIMSIGNTCNLSINVCDMCYDDIVIDIDGTISKNSDAYLGVSREKSIDTQPLDAVIDSDESSISSVSSDAVGAESCASDTVDDEEIATVSREDGGRADISVEDEVCDSVDDDILIGKIDDNMLYSESAPFYEAIKSHLEDIFSRYEHEDVLEAKIQGSRFARIYYADDTYYVVGEIVGDSGRVELICYGYPGEGGDMPPKDVGNSYEWLPLERDNTSGKGYYMMYQNGVTGDIITN